MSNQSIKEGFREFWGYVIAKYNQLKTYIDNSIIEYSLSKENNVIKLTGTNGSESSVEVSASIEVDNELSTKSENPVQNKIITNKINLLEE